MNPNEQQVRTAIAEQASEWFVRNDEGPLDEQDAAALAAWLKASPVHIEEFLAISTIARDLKLARTDPENSIDAILARARTADDPTVQALRPDASASAGRAVRRRWLPAAAAMAACVVLSVGLLLAWNARHIQHPAVQEAVMALHFETRHGEQSTQRLPDGSIVHLNTASAVTIRYGRTERLVMLTTGQAGFEVAHEPDRAFRVVAGPAEVVDIGTRFDVRVEPDSTVVTVIEGRVAVGPSGMTEVPGNSPGNDHARRVLQLGANQQTRVTYGDGPAAPIAVDAQRTTAWLHRQIAFDHETLERVAAEYNRYTSKPIDIANPALRTMQVSGVFAADDPDAFIAFLRSLKGVRVEVTETRIRVW